ncbi:uncharacterized protein MEPE_02302 [Melanopsichium pennsylvanicum]|uniref:CLASP N-terminal domain-containing protein n=2 Tax=Melanopsichium pennsylvanicum TaxID=63383 RepID=A0AAJ5C4E0_9BASI|nr:conserved hypothetical protein [Melanopsichium pennsylvanicum 4]SNX83595.1 uncharacterized protein MEPE_02302 [Melanopsichium pennsylvanicum]
MPSKPSVSDVKITLTSVTDLRCHFDEIYNDLHLPETEHTWQKIERALLHIQAITRGGATKFPEFVTLLKENAAPFNNSLLSERTKLSGTAGDLLNSIAPRLAERFEALVPVFLPTLLLICARTNKVAVKRAEKSLHFVVKHCKPPSVVSYLKEAIKDKAQGLRAVVAGTLVLVLECTEKERLARRVVDIEGCIRSGATDSNPEVRQKTKRLFELYVSTWPERVEQFTKPMTPTIRRYLSLPKTGALHVEMPPLTAAPAPAAPASAKPQAHASSSSDPSHLLEAAVPVSHPPPSRSAPAYSFFPDLKNSMISLSSSSSAMHNPAAPGFSVNDATYVKRGLFAEQIAAARSARMARVPSYNFDDLGKSSTENAPVHTMKRQPSYDRLHSHGAAPSGAAFRVPRFDVVPIRQDSDGSRPRSCYGHEPVPHMHGDINANTPSFAATSSRHGKSALLAACKQAFVGDMLSSKSSSSRERHHRDRSEKPSKHGDKRREKTVTVRFEPESDDKEDDEARHAADKASEGVCRSKSTPQIAIHAIEIAEQPYVQVKIPTDDTYKHHQDGAADREMAPGKDGYSEDGDDDDGERPSTPSERILHAQTPRTGVKASRVPAQRVAMASAVKVSAMRVAMPTPSAKIAASRVVSVFDSGESSPVLKARADAKTPRAQPDKVEVASALVKEQHNDNKEGASQHIAGKEAAEMMETNKHMTTADKKPTSSAVQMTKPASKPVPTKAAPSASLAAKARLEAKTARPVRAKPSATTAAAASKKVVTKNANTVSKATVVRKPISASSVTSKPVSKAAGPAGSDVNASKVATGIIRNAAAASAAVARARPAPTTKLATSAAPSAALAAKKAETAAAIKSSTSRLTAPTVSSRNKIVQVAAVKKFQPSKPSSLVTRPKSSIAASLTAKSKLVGAQAAASDKANAVRKASINMAVRIGNHQRASAAGWPTLPPAAPSSSIKAVGENGHDKEGEAADVAALKVEDASRRELEDKTVGERGAEEVATASKKEVLKTEEIAGTVPSEAVSEWAEAETESTQRNEESVDEQNASAEVVSEEEEQQGSMGTADAAPAVATPVKLPTVAHKADLVKARTPLSSKNTNLPKVTPLSNVTSEKIVSPISSSRIRAEARSTPARSPLRISATPKITTRLLELGQDESSFEESESESEEEEDTDEVVQLHLRLRPAAQEMTFSHVTHKVVAANRQFVLGVDSSDESSMMDANGDDETVVLDEQVA